MPKTRSRTTATPQWRAWHKKHRAKERLRKTAMVNALKEGRPCADCGRTFPTYAMDYDHVRGKKHADIGRMITDNLSDRRIIEEVAKCELVCAVCHRIRTHARMNAASRNVYFMPRRPKSEPQPTLFHESA